MVLEIIPALDIMDGNAVKVSFVKPYNKKSYGNPLYHINSWENAGVKRIMIFDINRFKGYGNNDTIIKTIVDSTNARILRGSGKAEESEILSYLEYSDKIDVLLGKISEKDPGAVKRLSQTYGRHRLFLDFTHDRSNKRGLTESEIVERIEQLGTYVEAIVVADIDRDATMKGLNTTLYQNIHSKLPNNKIIASSGFTRLEELKTLSDAGVHGLVVGRALFEEKFTIEQLLEAATRI